jgi:hypothetical protein
MTNSMIVPWLAVVTMVASLNGSHAQTLMPDQLAQRAIERRAVEAVNWGMAAVNYDLMLQEMLAKTAGKVNQLIYWGSPSRLAQPDTHAQSGRDLFDGFL